MITVTHFNNKGEVVEQFDNFPLIHDAYKFAFDYASKDAETFHWVVVTVDGITIKSLQGNLFPKDLCEGWCDEIDNR